MSSAVTIALVLSIAMMVLQFTVPYLRRITSVPAYCVYSFSGGFTMAYIFLHLLPGLAEHRETIGALLSEKYAMTPLMYLVVYLVGLIAFLLFYGLEKLAHRRKESAKDPEPLDFYIHLFSICLYSVLLTYTMSVRVAAGLPFAILFTFVMGLHFIIVDHNLDEHFPRRFTRIGRFVILGALCAGWILSAVHEPQNVFVVAILTAFLGGSILMSVFTHELPRLHRSSFLWLCVGAAFGTVLLAVMTVLENG